MAASIVKHVVVDSGGFIRNAPLREIGENVVTIPEVVHEIRDKATKERLQVLPYTLQFQQPTPEAIKAVSDFAKKTGDYRTLSAVDLKVMALTLQLEWQHVGRDHIKSKPDKQAEWTTTTKNLEKPTEIAGFYFSNKDTPANSRTTSISSSNDGTVERLSDALGKSTITDPSAVSNLGASDSITETDSKPSENSNTRDSLMENKVAETNTEDVKSSDDCQQDKSEGTDKRTGDKVDEVADTNGEESSRIFKDREGDTIEADIIEEGSDDDEEGSDDDEVDEDDDDDEGWITPSNIKNMKQSMGDVNIEKANVPVGCVTTDFSMQNVLIQMGLKVISVDGMLIKRARSYVLRCFACMKVTTNLMKDFCPHCGNNTLQRVSMSVDDDGNVKYYLSRRKPVSTRGLRYSLPTPKGGKHARNPILVEDQREAQQRGSKASRIKYDAMAPDYVTYNSPFAPIDTQSRAAQLGIRANFKKRQNPNETHKKHGRRK